LLCSTRSVSSAKAYESSRTDIPSTQNEERTLKTQTARLKSKRDTMQQEANDEAPVEIAKFQEAKDVSKPAPSGRRALTPPCL
jgi:hypothetical protein